jgi:glucose/arabinose dehydrogenase
VRIQLSKVADLTEPVALAWRPKDPRPGTLYLAERGGVVRALGPDGQLAAEPVLDMSSLTRAGGERGLLGLTFSPDGAYLYVDYTDVDGNSAIDSYQVDGSGNAVAGSRQLILAQAQPYANHNGGQVIFGPDGKLYIGFGDGGSSGDPQGNGQKLSTWLGKILRIELTPGGPAPYTVPADNPFVGRADAKPEIWSYGLRNPWRFTFDRANGDLWTADVGQNAIEEVDVARAAASAGQPGKGVNYGWSAFEGTSVYAAGVDAPGAVAPFHEYDHGDQLGGCSVSGGYVYRGSRIPALQGGYVFADYCLAGIRAIPTAGTSQATATALSDQPSTPVSFGEGPDGEVYVLSLDGGVYRLDPA